MLTTYLLRPASEPSEMLTRFMERVFDQISRCQRSAVNHHTISQRKLTMKKIALILLSSTLAACSPSGKPDKANLPTVDELALNPERLKELRKQCKLDRRWATNYVTGLPRLRESAFTKMAMCPTPRLKSRRSSKLVVMPEYVCRI